MSKSNICGALIAAGVFVILAGWMIGIRMEPSATGLQLAMATPERLNLLWIGTLCVFVAQLFHNRVMGVIQKVKSAKKGNFKLPAPEDNPKLYRLMVSFALAGLLIWPFVVSRGSVDLATITLIYVMLGLGLNVVVGLAGLLDLGYVGFYAVGAYSYALLNSYLGWGFWACLPVAGAMAALFGFILGFPVLRLRGDYLAIVTLGFGEIIRLLLNNLTGLTGGPNGIGGIEKPSLFGLEFNRSVKEGGWDTFHNFFGIKYSSEFKVIFLYLMAVLLVIFTIFVINRLLRMPIGRAWEALREDEIACRSLGLNPTVIKLTAFTIGAAFAGFAGSFFAARQGFISPESFTFIESAIILAIVVLGGMGSQIGVVLAAIIMTVLPELAREFNEYRMLMFGLMMVFMMLWRPQGLLPMSRPHMELEKDGQ
jgi:branched-chain amino acid transport system permease protein